MPRVMATSRAVSLRGGSGRRALWPDEQRPVGGEGDLEVGLAGDGAHAAGHRPLERLGRALDRLGAAVVRLPLPDAAPTQLSTTLAVDSGSSSPKQRW